MKKVSYAVGGAVLTALILIPTLFYLSNRPLASLDADLTINPLASNAFGSLTATSQDGTAESAAPLGLGGGGDAKSMVTRDQSGGGGASVGSTIAMPAPDYVSYRYVYQGEAITIESDQMPVLRRVKNVSGQSVGSILNNFNLGVADLSTFSGAKIQNITFIEDKSFGYMITVDAREGALAINKYWERWPQSQCQTPDCYERERIQEADVPADEVVIKIANDFLAAHKINVSNYGQPYVNKQWRLYYEQTADKSQFYFPEEVSVVYPLRIDSREIYELDGSNKVGITVGVDIKNNRVASLYNLTTQNYDSSPYAVETDGAKLLAIAERGGLYGWVDPNAPRTVDVPIGTPSVELVKIWHYDGTQSLELIVPALIFPVTVPADSQGYVQSAIVVPLVKDILDQQAADMPPIRTMEPTPLTEPAVAPEPDLAQ